MIILWPLYVLVFLKILNFLPTADRQKYLSLSYLMSEFFRLFLIPTWEIFWHCVLFFRYWCLFGLANRLIWGVFSFVSYVILCLFSSLSFLPYCPFKLHNVLFYFRCFVRSLSQWECHSFFPCKFFVLLWIMTFQRVSPGGLVFQTGACGICSVNYGSVFGERTIPAESPVGMFHRPLGCQESCGAPGLTLGTGGWLCRLLLVLAVAILHIYRKRMLLMSRWR